jgi:hypothetical protein
MKMIFYLKINRQIKEVIGALVLLIYSSKEHLGGIPIKTIPKLNYQRKATNKIKQAIFTAQLPNCLFTL